MFRSGNKTVRAYGLSDIWQTSPNACHHYPVTMKLDLSDDLICGEDKFEAAETTSDAGALPSTEEGPTDPDGEETPTTGKPSLPLNSWSPPAAGTRPSWISKSLLFSKESKQPDQQS